MGVGSIASISVLKLVSILRIALQYTNFGKYNGNLIVLGNRVVSGFEGLFERDANNNRRR